MSDDKLLTTREVRDKLRVSNGTLYGWRRRGYGPGFVKVGQKVLYPQSALDAFLRASAISDGSASFSSSEPVSGPAGPVPATIHDDLP